MKPTIKDVFRLLAVQFHQCADKRVCQCSTMGDRVLVHTDVGMIYSHKSVTVYYLERLELLEVLRGSLEDFINDVHGMGIPV
jgi:hypothetical protein